MLELPGIGALTAAKLVAELAGIHRFKNSSKLARLAGIAPIPASSGNNHRVRLSSRRQPSAQRGRLPRRDHAHANAPTRDRIHRPQDRRRQEQTRSHPLSQTPPHPHHLQHHAPHRNRNPGARLDIGARHDLRPTGA
ncbi:MAG: transposase [Solirubrobacteraceae bacterium]